MINLKNLIYLLPSMFKEKDTYKNSEGKGILERFLEVCGEYFNNEITPVIDDFLDIIDLDKTSEVYLNYVWEFLGKIPYSYGCIINGGKIESNLGDILKEENLPKADVRRILKYAISLYKIRGTLDFYNILFRFYGFPGKDEDPVILDDHTAQGDNEPTKLYSYYDDEMYYDSSITYDELIYCEGCSKVDLIIKSSDSWVLLNDDDPIKMGITNRIYLLLNRFRPLNVIPFDKTNVTFKYI